MEGRPAQAATVDLDPNEGLAEAIAKARQRVINVRFVGPKPAES